MAHRIRLGPPWEVTAAAGRTRHARAFGRPRTLDAAEQVWLVCASVPGPAEVYVNGELVGTVAGAGSPVATDITFVLKPRNELIIDTPSTEAVGEVALEIRAA